MIDNIAHKFDANKAYLNRHLILDNKNELIFFVRRQFVALLVESIRDVFNIWIMLFISLLLFSFLINFFLLGLLNSFCQIF